MCDGLEKTGAGCTSQDGGKKEGDAQGEMTTCPLICKGLITDGTEEELLHPHPIPSTSWRFLSRATSDLQSGESHGTAAAEQVRLAHVAACHSLVRSTLQDQNNKSLKVHCEYKMRPFR